MTARGLWGDLFAEEQLYFEVALRQPGPHSSEALKDVCELA